MMSKESDRHVTDGGNRIEERLNNRLLCQINVMITFLC